MESALQDKNLPIYDVSKQYYMDVHASLDKVMEAIRILDFSSSFPIRILLQLRGINMTNSMNMDGMMKMGFVQLEATPQTGIILGLIGKFWTLTGHLQRFQPTEFHQFSKPGYAKATWSFEVKRLPNQVTRVITETRVLCTDPGSARKFRTYWKLIGPFSGIIRKEILRILKKNLEHDN